MINLNLDIDSGTDAVENNQDSVKYAAEIFDKYGNIIRAVIKATINDTHQQDDIFQNFFISLVRRPIPKYVDNVKGYICRAVKNDIYDAKRKTKSYRSRISKHSHCIEKMHKQQTPQEFAIERELTQNITEIIERILPVHEANAIFDRFCINNTSLGKDYNKTHTNKRTLSRYVCVGLKNLRESLCMKENVIQELF